MKPVDVLSRAVRAVRAPAVRPQAFAKRIRKFAVKLADTYGESET